MDIITDSLKEEITKKEETILALECRLQDVTESKDIIQKELDETNCWYNNQQQLMGEMAKLNQHVSDLEE